VILDLTHLMLTELSHLSDVIYTEGVHICNGLYVLATLLLYQCSSPKQMDCYLIHTFWSVDFEQFCKEC
jgi:hypothetical protein